MKISDLKKNLLDLEKEERDLKKNHLKIIQKKEKRLRSQIEKLFLYSISEITWRIELQEDTVKFYHDLMWIPGINNKISSINGRLKLTSNHTKSVKGKAAGIKLKRNYITNRNFGKLLMFMEDKMESSTIMMGPYFISMCYDGFTLALGVGNNLESKAEKDEQFNLLSDFIEKTKIRLNLKEFNKETESLEYNLKFRNMLLTKNSNSFLFGF